MSLLKTLAELIGEGEGLVPPPYRIVMLGNKKMYIEGVLGIRSYTPSVLILIVKDGYLEINGQNLILKGLINKDITIFGKISSVAEKKE